MHLRRLHSFLFAGLLAAAVPMMATDCSPPPSR